MQVKIEQINVATDTWGTVFERLNESVETISNNAVVVIANTVGDAVTGNGFVVGIFGANTLVANTIRGGNVSSVGTLSVNSAVVFQNAVSMGTTSDQYSLTVNTTGTSIQTIDSWAIASYRSAKYLIQVKSNVANAHQVTEMMVMHDGTAALSTEYATLASNGSLGTMSVDVDSGNARLRFTPAATNTVVKIFRTLLTV
jgi:hypothetical protein